MERESMANETALAVHSRTTAEDREALQQAFIRICRDSGFQLDAERACALAAKVLGRSPLEIWMAMPSLDVMREVAAGTHPVVASARTAKGSPETGVASRPGPTTTRGDAK
jgi:hypothetical protein